MKKLVIICVCIAYAGMSTALIARTETPVSYLQKSDGDDYTVINLSNMSADQVEAFFSGDVVSMVLECPEGVSLPIHLSISGQFLHVEPLENPAYRLKILRTCFIKHVDQTFYFSDDCLNWIEFSDFFSGSIGVALGESADEVSLILKLDRK